MAIKSKILLKMVEQCNQDVKDAIRAVMDATGCTEIEAANVLLIVMRMQGGLISTTMIEMAIALHQEKTSGDLT